MNPKRSKNKSECQSDQTLEKNNNLSSHQKFSHLSDSSKFKFQCSFCNYNTNHKNTLVHHIRSHTGEKPYKCQYPNCGMAFAKNCTLTTHQLVHNKGDPTLLKFKCSFCPYKAARNSILTVHLKTHSDVREFSCPLCPYRAKDSGSLRIHHRHVHSTEKPFKCTQPDCNYSFKSKGGLNRHLLVHSNDRPFACSFAGCDFSAKRSDSLKAHQLGHSEEKPLKCSLCHFTCYDKTGLLCHVRGHTGEAPYPCRSCPFRGRTMGYLNYHVNRVHREKKTSERKNTSSHRERTTDCTEKRFKCPFCPYSSRYKCALVSHTPQHTGRAPFLCKSCPYRAYGASNFKKHVNSYHQQKNNKESEKEESLAVDYNSRPGKLRIICFIVGCGFRTRQYSMLAGHLNKIHGLPRVGLKKF